jgi:hypothetical protein
MELGNVLAGGGPSAADSLILNPGMMPMPETLTRSAIFVIGACGGAVGVSCLFALLGLVRLTFS